VPRKKSKTLDIISFCTDPQLLGLSLSPAQETLLRSVYGLPLTPKQLDIFKACTGRQTYRAGHSFPEITVVAGARSGKDSRIAAPIAIYEALFGGHAERLARGEIGMIPLIAQDKTAANVALSYIKGYLLESPNLRSMVAGDPLSTELSLVNGIRISCFPCSQRSLRSWSIPVGIMDEVAHYGAEGGANSDVEIQSSIRRGQVGFGKRSRLVKISTPWARDGLLYSDFERAFGKDDPDILCFRASTSLMNPSIDADRLEQERRLDPSRYLREYDAQFLDDTTAFLPLAWIVAATITGRFELPPQPGRVYCAGVDATGAGGDTFSFSISHPENDTGQLVIVQDALRGWTKSRTQLVDLEGVVQEIVDLCIRYAIPEVIGDKYARGWVRQAFERRGIRYVDAPDKSTLYASVEPMFAQGMLQILDHPVLHRQLQTLERRNRAGGKAQIEKPRGSHDDYANALALSSCAAFDLAGCHTDRHAPLVR